MGKQTAGIPRKAGWRERLAAAMSIVLVLSGTPTATLADASVTLTPGAAEYSQANGTSEALSLGSDPVDAPGTDEPAADAEDIASLNAADSSEASATSSEDAIPNEAAASSMDEPDSNVAGGANSAEPGPTGTDDNADKSGADETGAASPDASDSNAANADAPSDTAGTAGNSPTGMAASSTPATWSPDGVAPIDSAAGYATGVSAAGNTASASTTANPAGESTTPAGTDSPGAQLSAIDEPLGLTYARVTLSGTQADSATALRVYVGDDGIAAGAVAGSDCPEGLDAALPYAEQTFSGDGDYDFDGVQLQCVRLVVLLSADGTQTVLLDAQACTEQLAQMPEATSYHGLGSVTVGADGDYTQPTMGFTDDGGTWSYTYKTYEADGQTWFVQCVSPTASAGYAWPRDTSLWTTDSSVSFLEYVASRGYSAKLWGVVDSSDAGYQAVQSLAAQTYVPSGENDATYAAEHLILSAALQLQIAHGVDVFDQIDADAAWTEGYIWNAVCNAMSGYNYAAERTVYVRIADGMSWDDSNVAIAQALYTLWGQYQSQDYEALMAGLDVESWLGFANSSADYTSGLQHIYGYRISKADTPSPEHGRIDLVKVSSEPVITDGNSCYSLENARYGIYSDPDCTNEVGSLVTNAGGYAISEELEVGTYYVRETNASAGYAKSDDTYEVQVSSGATACVGGEGASVEEPPQNDPALFKVQKLDAVTGEAVAVEDGSLAGALFVIRYYAGDYETASDLPEQATRTWTIQTDETGYSILDADHLVAGSDELYYFGGIAGIPLGSYTIEETAAPTGYLVAEGLSDTVYHVRTDGSDSQTVTADLYVEVPEPRVPEELKIATSLATATGDKQASLTEPVTLVDTVTYQGLTTGAAYELYGTLCLKSTGEAVLGEDGQALETRVQLTPESSSGQAQVAFEVPASALATSDSLVCFEDLYLVGEEGLELVASHRDLDDEGQTVFLRAVSLSTHAFVASTELQEGPAAGCTVMDEVSYKGLPDGSYTLRARLVSAADGTQVIAEGERSIEVAGEPDGYAYVSLPVESAPAGSYVVLETLCDEDGGAVASHADLNDASQTVSLVEIATQMLAANGAHETQAAASVQLTDTVSYQGLTPGAEYALQGTLMDKASGNPVTDADGNPVTASTTLYPDSADGTAEVTYTIDASALTGRTVVSFESLAREGKEVAAHADLEDSGQSVNLVGIGTTALGATSHAHEQTAGDGGIVDTVAYQGLTPGAAYTLRASVRQAGTGAVLTLDGKAVTAETTFTAEGSEGSAQVTIDFDTTVLAGASTVVYEELYDAAGHLVASECDKDSSSQRTSHTKLATSAVDRQTGTRTGSVAGATATVRDTVTYSGLTANRKYTLKAEVYVKTTGEPLCSADGTAINAETVLVPAESEGTAVVDLTFPASLVTDGMSTVVFESLYDADGNLVAHHRDLTDENQTVTWANPTVPTTPTTPTTTVTTLLQTGVGAGPVALLGAGMAMLGGAALAGTRRRREEDKAELAFYEFRR